ncbi:MAG: DUF4290 domain-containing protein [Prevotellaceae bacterium]|nr:DUF4290 domain-containing protein [Prevotellaceae bacterium]
MTYNTQREKMRLPEYGRYVHEMARHIASLPDRDVRQREAEALVSIMANINPDDKDQPDFMQRIWDHLAYLCDYRLDIDFPYEVTRLGEEARKPERLPYPWHDIGQRHYGHLIEEALDMLRQMPPGPKRDKMAERVANQMKQSLFVWNRDAMDNEKVAADMYNYTQGEVELDLRSFRFAPVCDMPRSYDPLKKKKK